MIGRVFAQRYRLEEFIGKGGMALVFRATDLRTGHDVAVKILRPEFNNDKEFLERFEREALAASKMSHHNIVNLLDGLRNCDALQVNEGLAETYTQWIAQHPAVPAPWGKWPHSHPEMPVPPQLAESAKAHSDQAVIVIGRCIGEGQDAALQPGSFYLTDTEKEMLKNFRKKNRKKRNA